MINTKRIVLFFLLLVVVVISSSCSRKTKDNFDYVYKLEAKCDGKQSHVGTCFYSDGYFYTNSHLILYKDYTEYFEYETIVAIDDFNNVEYELEIIDYEIQNDYARLKSKEDLNVGKGLNIYYNYSCRIGEDIFTIGNNNNAGLAFGYGRITSNRKIINNMGFDIEYYQTNIEISGGNSGGPIFNQKNEVIGIMSMKMVDNSGNYVDGASFFCCT